MRKRNNIVIDNNNELKGDADIGKMHRLELTYDEKSIYNHVQLAINNVNQIIDIHMLVKIYDPYRSLIDDYVNSINGASTYIDKHNIQFKCDKIIYKIIFMVTNIVGDIDVKYPVSGLEKFLSLHTKDMRVGDALGYLTSALINDYNKFKYDIKV